MHLPVGINYEIFRSYIFNIYIEIIQSTIWPMLSIFPKFPNILIYILKVILKDFKMKIFISFKWNISFLQCLLKTKMHRSSVFMFFHIFSFVHTWALLYRFFVLQVPTFENGNKTEAFCGNYLFAMLREMCGLH